MPLISAPSLRDFAVAALRNRGAPEAEANIVADSLVEADLTDHEGHGVSRLPRYCSQINQGLIVPGMTPEKLGGVGSLARYDCKFGFGQSALDFVTRSMIAQANEHHLALSFLFRCNHVGRLAYFSEHAARNGLCAIILCNVNGKPRVSTHGGIDPRLGTNPLAMAVPWHDGVFSFDSSTSAVVEGVTHVRHLNGELMPAGMLIDADGKPTRDPGAIYATPSGSILPIGIPENIFKIAGLAMALDVFAGLLSGSGFPKPDAPLGRNGVMVLIFNPAFLISATELNRSLDEYSAWIKSARKAEGVDEILLPGEPERRAKIARLLSGVPISDGTWADLTRLHEELGLTGALDDAFI